MYYFTVFEQLKTMLFGQLYYHAFARYDNSDFVKLLFFKHLDWDKNRNVITNITKVIT